jgi:flagellar biosynthesis anti-sigma factor FlgM
MEILSASQQAGLTQQLVNSQAERAPSGGSLPKVVAIATPQGDTVTLSSSLDQELKSQQVQQAARVESIKSLVKTGQYQVSSSAVAEKMLSTSANN